MKKRIGDQIKIILYINIVEPAKFELGGGDYFLKKRRVCNVFL